MRLWTIHPRYLDAQGLVALWREGLLAQKVLAGKTRGYRHHPQLTRFLAIHDPLAAIATYLSAVREEAVAREYSFDANKLTQSRFEGTLEETQGQLLYEWKHLRAKLKRRSPATYRIVRAITVPEAHPLFRILPGEVRDWERV